MSQHPERKKAYAKERYAEHKERLNAKAAEWRDVNREHLKYRSRKRRLEKRAMCLVAAARVRAARRGIPFSLQAVDIAALQAVIDVGRCELSGATFTLDGPRGPRSPSLDRVNPVLGYVPGNVRVVCHCLNAALGDWGEEETLQIMRQWVNRRP